MLLTLMFLGLAALVAPSVSYGCYGDLRTMETPVISCGAVQTPTCGAHVAEKIAEIDVVRLKRYQVPITRVARNLCIDPALIAAVMSVESRAGATLVDGWNRERTRYGLMQVHTHYNSIPGAWDSEEHITQGATILVTGIKALQTKYPTWSWQQYLRGGICAYHDKVRNIQVYDGVDNCNSSNDYVNNVIIRAKYLQNNGFSILV
ncbi:beta-galactoside alpha-2,6-sialyltransferase 2 [Platysternon megacephalum]|uniref:Lysozyme g n=1 Tax=Platysternon megacephalum TaxID=55544 RepID=A0A4D9ECS7_9SAUR|nr:beta-galactoside alpha-2,6-sialyltransferase 2 [Platysternon megacephalum]